MPEVHGDETSYHLVDKASVIGLGETVPTFAVANYVELARPTVTLFHIADHTSLARDYAARRRSQRSPAARLAG